MAYDPNDPNAPLVGKMPDGATTPIPVSGVADSTKEPLGPGEVWTSARVEYSGNEAVLFAMQSDVAGSYQVEYLDDEGRVDFMGNTTQYIPSAEMPSFQGALHGKAGAFRLVYTNGPVAQNKFYCEIRFAAAIQETLRSAGAPMSSTNLAGTTHAAIEGRENGTGAYKQATTTTEGQKTALDVHVVNPPTATPALDISGLATEATLKQVRDWLQTTAMQPGDLEPLATEAQQQALIEAVEAIPTTDTSLLAKESRQTDGSQKTQVTNLPTDYAKSTDISDANAALLQALAAEILVRVANPTDVSLLGTESTLQAILNKAAPAFPTSFTVSNPTPATDVSALAKEQSLLALIAAIQGTLKVDLQDTDYSKDSTAQAANGFLTAIRDKLIVGPATEATLAAVLSKLIANPATENTTAAILAKLIANPATETGLQAILSKITANAATEATLALLLAKFGSLGQKTAAGSAPMVLASDQSAIPVTLPAGFATSANQGSMIQTAGATTDTAVTDSTIAATQTALLKGLVKLLSPASTTVVTPVTTLATLTPILAANPNRKSYSAFSLTGTILIKDGPNASATSFSHRVITNAETYPQIPYNGVVTAIGAGTLIVTEYF